MFLLTLLFRERLGDFEDAVLMPGCALLWCVAHARFYRRSMVGTFTSTTALEEEGVVSYHEVTVRKKALVHIAQRAATSPENVTHFNRVEENGNERLLRINEHLHRLTEITRGQKAAGAYTQRSSSGTPEPDY